MTELKIRCFGGLDVRRGGVAVTGFESRKVRALLAYLVCQRDRAFTREHLATLLWPEKNDDAARRNLRQALYNLKNVLADRGDPTPIAAHQGTLQIAPTVEFWLDVAAFDTALETGTSAGGINPHHLAGAARLYQGAFLSDLPLREDTPFEDWLTSERERLHEQALAAFRLLVESYLSRGEYRLGIQHAQRLVSLDPLSEEGHRYLMRLYAQAGRRGRAIGQYKDLKTLLQRELDVDPLEETQRLYQQILAEESPVVIGDDESDPIGPVIPLVGRSEAMEQLGAIWADVRRGQARLTTVVGEPGIGKTRLTRAFLDVATSQEDVTVVMGGCVKELLLAYQPFPKVVRRALAETVTGGDGYTDWPPALLAELSLLVPDLARERPDLPEPRTSGDDPLPLFGAVETLIRKLIGETANGTAGVPVILYLDDLDWAGPETGRLVQHLMDHLSAEPVWVVATCSARETLADSFPTGDEVVKLERLDVASVEEIAAGIVTADQRSDLVALLVGDHRGLPMNIAETINLLWDESALVPDRGGSWRLEIDRETEVLDDVASIDDMIARRLRRLPSSTRRMATLAAVIGQEFQPAVVREAAGEHPAVVDIGMEVLLERWLVRPYAEQWASSTRKPAPARDSRHARFDYTHRWTRDAIYTSVAPNRRRYIHRQIVDAYEALFGADSGLHCELLAHHSLAAEAWDRALPYLEATLAKAMATGADELAARCRDLRLRVDARRTADGKAPADEGSPQPARVASP